MTSATEILRRLLDERGVEWREHEAPATDCIAFFDGNGWHDCWESVDGEVNVTFSMTPAQAVAATLGPGTCHAVFEVDAMSEDERIGEFVCSECGETLGDRRDQWPRYCPNCGKRVVE